MGFNRDNARRRAAELGKLLGPIYVRGCGPAGGEGEVYFTARTVRQDIELKRLADMGESTYAYRQVLLRAKHKDGERIWEDDEIDDVLGGGVDPTQIGMILGAMYMGDKYKRKPEGTPGRFSKEAARKSFESIDGLYGPVTLPGIGDDGDLDVFYKPLTGYQDCAMIEMRKQFPSDYSARNLLERALDRSGKKMFVESDLGFICDALLSDELDAKLSEMRSPSFMTEEERLRMLVASELDPEPSLDDLKN